MLPQLPLDTDSIEADGFVLRRLVREDAAALFPTLSNEGQCRFMSQPHFTSEDELADWLDDTTWPGRSWTAVDTTDGSIAGRFVAFPGRDAGVLEMGYITVAGRQGMGVARRCMTALITYLFASGPYRRVFLEIDVGNTPSIALAERLGFMREGLLRQHETTHNGVCDLLVYGLLRDEWMSGM